jgi:hypothetical protein
MSAHRKTAMSEDIDLQEFTDACLDAGAQSDVPAYYLVAVAEIESGIKNKPATGPGPCGPFQIQASTWAKFMEVGGFDAEDRTDPIAQPFVAATIAAAGIAALRTVLPNSTMPSWAELYCTHFFGVDGAKVILGGDRTLSIRTALETVFKDSSDPKAEAETVISGNTSLLTSTKPDGTKVDRTVQEVIDEIDKRLKAATAKDLPPDVADISEPDMHGELVAKAVSGNTTFWVVTKTDAESGGQLLIKQTAGQRPQIILADTTVFPVKSNGVPQAVADQLNKAHQDPGQSGQGHADPPPHPDEDISQRVFTKAVACDQNRDLISRNVRGTHNGIVGCAWAVNELVRRALGKTIGGGLSTAAMFNVLQSRHRRLNENQIVPGCIIISPTRGGNHGHVGVVGRIAANIGDTPIYSNSSAHGDFERNFTIGKWRARYRDKLGLEVDFFALNKQFFDQSSAAMV